MFKGILDSLVDPGQAGIQETLDSCGILVLFFKLEFLCVVLAVLELNLCRPG